MTDIPKQQDSKTDRNGDPMVGLVLDIIDKERSRYKVAVAVAAYIEQYNKAALRTQLEKLEAQLPSDDVVSTKYGYHSDEKKYGFRIGITEAKLVIQQAYKELGGAAS